MRIHHLKIIGKLFLAATSFILFAEKVIAQRADHITGDVIVMMQPGKEISSLVSEFTVYDNCLTGISTVKQLSVRLNIWQLHFNASAIDENKFLSGIRNSNLVKLAQFNHYAELRNTPNDPDFGQQWNMLNIGQTGGTLGADVRATTAWDLTTGGLTADGDTIVIAIDDDGFDLAHEDINYWKNHKEIPGNSIDDDGNGYVDDYDGWNAQNENGIILSSSHGTHVSGIAGAIGNNGKGIAGVNWNVQIMPVQGNSGVEATAVAGYAYILEMRAKYNETAGASGAFVVSTNSSWGVDFAQPSNYPIWCAMYDSLGHYGILSAAATNNSNNVNVDTQGDMPTACVSDYLIAVTSTDQNDQRVAAFGATTIDLAAPGTSILSTIPGNLYAPKTGTSMASPHVAGAVALLCSLPCEELSNDLKNDPAGTSLRIKSFIMSGTDQVVSMEGVSVSEGRLNVYQALLNAAAYYDCNVGISNVASPDHEVIIYPNPATEEVTIVIKNHSIKMTNILLVNSLGQEVLKKEISDLHAGILHLDVSSLQRGLYLMKLISEDQTRLIGKVILN